MCIDCKAKLNFEKFLPALLGLFWKRALLDELSVLEIFGKRYKFFQVSAQLDVQGG